MLGKRTPPLWCAMCVALTLTQAVVAAPDASKDDPRAMFKRAAGYGWIVPFQEVDRYKKALYQARGMTNMHRVVTPSRAALAEMQREAARTEPNMDVKGPMLDANATYTRLGVVRHMHMGAGPVIDPAAPSLGGQHVSPRMLRSLGGRYASVWTRDKAYLTGMGGQNLSYGGPAIRANVMTSTYYVVRGEVPRGTIRMTPKQRREVDETGDISVLDPTEQQKVMAHHSRLDVLRELNSRRAEGEELTFSDVVAERRARYEAAMAAREAERNQVAQGLNPGLAAVPAQPQANVPQAKPFPNNDILQQNLALLRRTEQRIDQLQHELNELRGLRQQVAANVERLLQQREAFAQQQHRPAPKPELTREQIADLTQQVMLANPDLALKAASGDADAQQQIWAMVQREAAAMQP